MKKFDYIVIGAGFFGLYSALVLARRGHSVLVCERDARAMQRASYVNQARIHLGYHYPRSVATVKSCIKYFDRFNDEFALAINKEFTKIYAVAKDGSWTSPEQFLIFCKNLGIPATVVHDDDFHDHDTIVSYLSKEYSFDAAALESTILDKLREFKENIEIKYNHNIAKLTFDAQEKLFWISNNNWLYKADSIINCSYSATNFFLNQLSLPPIQLKYQLCEVILCRVSGLKESIGFTLMDGPFFSFMPFGFSGLYSLTSVKYTPHYTVYSEYPEFPCQKNHPTCSPNSLENCQSCAFKPQTNFRYMNQLVKKYLNENIKVEYVSSLFTIRTLLRNTSFDDARPTFIDKHYLSNSNYIATVLSGKINTVYDLEENI